MNSQGNGAASQVLEEGMPAIKLLSLTDGVIQDTGSTGGGSSQHKARSPDDDSALKDIAATIHTVQYY